jgi:hypothetical protein
VKTLGGGSETDCCPFTTTRLEGLSPVMAASHGALWPRLPSLTLRNRHSLGLPPLTSNLQLSPGSMVTSVKAPLAGAGHVPFGWQIDTAPSTADRVTEVVLETSPTQRLLGWVLQCEPIEVTEVPV